MKESIILNELSSKELTKFFLDDISNFLCLMGQDEVIHSNEYLEEWNNLIIWTAFEYANFNPTKFLLEFIKFIQFEFLSYITQENEMCYTVLLFSLIHTIYKFIEELGEPKFHINDPQEILYKLQKINREEWIKNPFKYCSYIYLIKNETTKYIKIGRSVNPNKRLSNIKTGSTDNLTLLHTSKLLKTRQTERFLHNLYKDKKVRGEWFNLSKSNINKIKKNLVILSKTHHKLVENFRDREIFKNDIPHYNIFL